MSEKISSAERLLNIIKSVERRDAKLAIKDIWAKEFGFDPNDLESILNANADIIHLVKEVKEDIRSLEDLNQDLYLAHINKIEEGLSKTHYFGQWSTFKQYIDEPTMIGLAFVADTLSNRIGEKVIPHEDLDELLKEVNTLLESVINADLPDSLRDLIVTGLEDIRRAILTYKLKGAKGLNEALEKSLGSLFANFSLVKDHIKKKPTKDFMGVLDKAHKMIVFALKAKELAAPIYDLITGGTGTTS
ncbi:MAG: hypothetical protein DWQ07_25810 [Chloroflexi bacterium]|nr:MAG: hypothetical protein DWQ07_25810 [Chloroflexota bacterium]